MTVVPFRCGAEAAGVRPFRPVVLIADAGPLAYLAGVGALDTLERVGTRTEMLDMVLGEALRATSTNGHGRLATWVRSGIGHGLVQVRPTAARHIAKLAAGVPSDQQGPATLLAASLQEDLPTMVAGWLTLRLLDLSRPALVLHAGGLVGQVAAAHAREGQVAEAKLGAFLERAAGLAETTAPSLP